MAAVRETADGEVELVTIGKGANDGDERGNVGAAAGAIGVGDGIGGDAPAPRNHRIFDAASDGSSAVYAWIPLPDITAYELALCMPIFSTRIDSGSAGHAVDRLPANAQRHFTRLG